MSTPPPPSPETRYWYDLLESLYRGRRWLLATDTLASGAHLAKTIESLGAEATLCVAASLGAGSPAHEEFAHAPLVLGVRSETMMSAIHASLDALASLSPEHVARIDAFDPRGEARSIGELFDDGRPVGGRVKYGARRASWQALEDKTVIDALWVKLGVPHAPYRVVPFTDDALRHAHQELDQGLGTVCAIDNSLGFHGGAKGTHWLTEASRIAPLLEQYAGKPVREARVMPFLEGLPCSIHGIVFPDYVAALRPCEMLVFRSRQRALFHYAGSATFWEPAPAQTEALRALARQVGEHLREAYGYRGAFTIDGVMTAQGFLPTELNPRFGAALNYIARALPELPLLLLNLAIVEGEPLDWRPEALEALLLDAAARHPAGGAGSIVSQVPAHAYAFPLHLDPARGRWRIAGAEEPIDARFIYGEASAGGYMRAGFDSARTPIGPSVAPRALELLRFLDQLFAFDLPEDLAPGEVF